MLLPEEFTVGPIADAVPLTLMLPRSRYEHQFLIGGIPDDPVAVCFAEEYRFRAFQCAGNDAHKGVLIARVTIEVDAESLFDPNSHDVPMGALIRRGTSLSVMAKMDGHGFHSAQSVTLVSGLTEARDGCAVGFRRWSVGLGRDENRRTLLDVDLKQA